MVGCVWEVDLARNALRYVVRTADIDKLGRGMKAWESTGERVK